MLTSAKYVLKKSKSCKMYKVVQNLMTYLAVLILGVLSTAARTIRLPTTPTGNGHGCHDDDDDDDDHDENVVMMTMIRIMMTMIRIMIMIMMNIIMRMIMIMIMMIMIIIKMLVFTLVCLFPAEAFSSSRANFSSPRSCPSCKCLFNLSHQRETKELLSLFTRNDFHFFKSCSP